MLPLEGTFAADWPRMVTTVAHHPPASYRCGHPYVESKIRKSSEYLAGVQFLCLARAEMSGGFFDYSTAEAMAVRLYRNKYINIQ